jgi:glycosyltransferase involved in cell wall biosynthesis
VRVFHIITGLRDGGAEGVLFRLCTHDSLDEHLVVSLSDEGKYGALLRAKGILVYPLYMRANRPSLIAFVRLVRLLKMHKPDVIQTWMYHADLFGGIAGRIAGVRNIVWGIRATTPDFRGAYKSISLMRKILAILSGWLPSKIAVCAKRAITSHAGLGYEERKMRLIPNGYDLSEFMMQPVKSEKFREEHGIQKHDVLLGCVGRYDPLKDYSNLLHALSILKQKGIRFYLILIGLGLDNSNAELRLLLEKLNLSDVVRLLGQRDDIPIAMGAFDLHVLSSSAEGFPNVVCEAMSCETPCVVTDVGDAAYIVGETGWVVPPQDHEALAISIEMAIEEMRSDSWNRRCLSTRERVAELFSIEKMVGAYRQIWQDSSS